MAENSKQCYYCKEELPLEDFNDTANKHLLKKPALKGKRYACKKCEKLLFKNEDDNRHEEKGDSTP